MTSSLPDLARVLSELSDVDFQSAFQVYKNESSTRKSRAVFAFRVGQKVEFTGRRGQILRGIVESINRTTVTVKVGEGDASGAFVARRWRVSANILRGVA